MMAAIKIYLRDGRNEHKTDDGGRGLPDRPATHTGVGRSNRERSRYAPLANLLNTVGGTLKPKVFCVGELADQGAGHPDFGLYAAKQVQKGRPRDGQVPDGGVVEVKSADDDAWLTAGSEQVSRYWSRYRLVLVTNTRDFVLLGEDGMGAAGQARSLPIGRRRCRVRPSSPKATRFRCPCPARVSASICAGRCRSAPSLPNQRTWPGCSPRMRAMPWRVSKEWEPRRPWLRYVRRWKRRSGYASRAIRGRASFTRPWSRRCSTACSRPGCCGARSGSGGGSSASFNWREAIWHLRAPVLQALFQQLATPNRLQPLGLVEVLGLDRRGARPRGPFRVLRQIPAKARPCRISTNPSWKPSIPRCASSWACGTRQQRSCATWSPGWTRRSRTTLALPTGWRRTTSTCLIRAAALGRIWPRSCAGLRPISMGGAWAR